MSINIKDVKFIYMIGRYHSKDAEDFADRLILILVDGDVYQSDKGALQFFKSSYSLDELDDLFFNYLGKIDISDLSISEVSEENDDAGFVFGSPESMERSVLCYSKESDKFIPLLTFGYYSSFGSRVHTNHSAQANLLIRKYEHLFFQSLYLKR